MITLTVVIHQIVIRVIPIIVIIILIQNRGKRCDLILFPVLVRHQTWMPGHDDDVDRVRDLPASFLASVSLHRGTRNADKAAQGQRREEGLLEHLHGPRVHAYVVGCHTGVVLDALQAQSVRREHAVLRVRGKMHVSLQWGGVK